MIQDTKQSILLKEAKPIIKVSHQGKCLTPPRDTIIDVCVLDIGSKSESYMLTEVPRKEPNHKLSHEPPHKWKPKIELSVVQIPRLKVSFSDLKTSKTLDYTGIMHLSLPKSFDPGIRQEVVHNNQGQKLQRRQQTKTSCPKKKIILQLVEAIKVSLEISNYFYQCPNTDIMHLLFVQKVENFSGCKEESFKEIPPNNLLLLGESTLRETRNDATKTLKGHPLQKRCNVQNHRRGVILSYLSKEKPPDAQSIPKPKQYQGKTLESQKSMKADLLYFGAGYPVSRSKLCQGGGYDAVIRSATEPEVNPKPYSTSQGANQDIRALKMPYLTNQKGLNHESNFDGF
ncbi:unnamed protein product [Brassica oleracea]